MIYPPVAENPLRTRDDLQRVVRDLFEPLNPFFTEGRAAISLAGAGTRHGRRMEGLEAFSRPLWGLVPLAAGGGAFAHWDSYQEGFAHGPDPQHPEAWPDVTWASQAHVEMAAIALTLALTPEKIWEPLTPEGRERLVDWLLSINRVALPRNNWYFFRVLVNVGLRSVGARHDAALLVQTLDEIDTYYLGDGWYADGIGQPCDYYVSYALHYYGLIYAVVSGREDPVRAERFRGRAARFAQDFVYWQDGDGAMLPYGRSLAYRFAQAAFWSAYAFAEVPGGPAPGVVKGLVLRHLRHWLRKPIFNEGGVLSVGYGYPNLLMAESYNGPGSPYWACKTFLVLALPESHAFWQAEELPYPELDTRREVRPAGMILCRDQVQDLTVALCCGVGSQFSHWAEKYMKFAYSPHFGISVPTQGVGLQQRGHDNALALSEEGLYWRVRRDHVTNGLADGVLWTRWLPWPDVEITSWVWPEESWHVRVHHLRTGRALQTAEGGFALSRESEDPLGPEEWDSGQKQGLRMRVGASGSAVLNLLGARVAERVDLDPNSHLDRPLAHVPTLRGALAPGDHWLAIAVKGERKPTADAGWQTAPRLDWTNLPARLRALLPKR